MRITIGRKLTFGFGCGIAFLFAILILGGMNYLKTIQAYEQFTNPRFQQAHRVEELAVEFKKEVEAWKNILIRGDDPAKFMQCKGELDREIEIVRQKIGDLKTGPYRLLFENGLQELMKFEREHQKLKEGYDAALKVYTGGAGGNYKEADALVAGMDKLPTQKLLELADQCIEVTNQMVKDDAARVYGLGIAISVAVLIVFLLGLFFTFFIIRSITLPLKSLTAAAGILAQGDLTQEITVKSNDEIGDLANGLRNMAGGFRAILLKLREAADKITASGNEILSATLEQVAAAREQSSAVAETTSASKELSATSEQVGESIKKVAQVAAHALAGMAKIKETTARTNVMLGSLGEKSQKIGRIIELIDDVAGQTNLLAVNASIEAARAGEQGRGFTVVADEIRKLADSTAKSTQDITALIELIQHEMSNAVLSMEQSVTSVDEEARLAQQTTEKAQEIAMNTHQQVSGSKQIADAMMSIDETMKQIATGAQHSQVAAKQLTDLAEDLKQAASKFKL